MPGKQFLLVRQQLKTPFSLPGVSWHRQHRPVEVSPAALLSALGGNGEGRACG